MGRADHKARVGPERESTPVPARLPPSDPCEVPLRVHALVWQLYSKTCFFESSKAWPFA